jgi:hypothetical protein
MKIDDVDGLTRAGYWNNVRAYYNYAGTPEAPYLILNFELETSAYEPGSVLPDSLNPLAAADIPPWQQNALDDKEKFTAIGFQLDRNYDCPDIPGISGQGVSIFLTDALLKSEKIPLSHGDFQSFRNFVADCLVYVTRRAGEWSGGSQPVCRLEIPFSLDDVSESDITGLSLTLSFEAQEPPTISPPPEEPLTKFECDIEDLTVSPRKTGDFVASFENIFFNKDWQMRIAQSALAGNPPDKKQSAETWAVRMGKKPDTGFYYEIQNQVCHYAPRPIAETIKSATVSINKYVAGERSTFGDKVPMTFTDVDLNDLAKMAFSAIDSFFLPGLATSISKIDSLLSGESETDGYLFRFWEHKRMLAAAVAETVIPIFNSSASDEISLVAAREKLCRSLLTHLSNAFISSCATVFSVSNVSIDRLKTGEILPGRFYGQFQKYEAPSAELEGSEQEAAETPGRDYSLSAGKIQYFKSADGQTGGWRLPFLFSSGNAGQQSAVALPLAYTLTHLELDVVKEPNIQNYDGQSTWLQFTGKPLITQVGSIEFPVILPAVPAPPQMIAQSADSNAAKASTAAPSELTFWDYSLSYDSVFSAQSSLTVSITLNNQKTLVYSRNEAHPLFAPLVQFVTVCDDIYTDLEKQVGELNDSSKVTDPEVENAITALDAFEKIFGELAAAYEQWAFSLKGMTPSSELSPETGSFDFVLKSGTHANARLDVISRISDSAPTPVIEIENYTRREAPDKPDYALVSYNYVLSESPQAADDGKNESLTYLSYENALSISRHIILLKGLNIFTTQNALGQIQIFRNARTNEAATIDDSFKLFSPPARFHEPIIPSLKFSDFDLSAIQVSGATLENYLDGFFSSLLKEADGIPLSLKMTVSFSYKPLPSEDDGAFAVLPVTILPPVKVVPQRGAPLSIVAALARQITDWTKSVNPVLDSSSQYNIRLEVFGEEPGHPPLLAIDNVFIKTAKIIEAS